jgi:hypothetical protein
MIKGVISAENGFLTFNVIYKPLLKSWSAGRVQYFEAIAVYTLLAMMYYSVFKFPYFMKRNTPSLWSTVDLRPSTYITGNKKTEGKM